MKKANIAKQLCLLAFCAFMVLATLRAQTEGGGSGTSQNNSTANCTEGQALCLDTCYDTLNQTCVQNTTICPLNSTELCGESCFNPTLMTCHNGNILCGLNETLCGYICAGDQQMCRSLSFACSADDWLCRRTALFIERFYEQILMIVRSVWNTVSAWDWLDLYGQYTRLFTEAEKPPQEETPSDQEQPQQPEQPEQPGNATTGGNRCDGHNCPSGEICCDDVLVGPLCYVPGQHTCTSVGNNQTRYCCCPTCLPCGADHRCYRTESHQCVNGIVVPLPEASPQPTPSPQPSPETPSDIEPTPSPQPSPSPAPQPSPSPSPAPQPSPSPQPPTCNAGFAGPNCDIPLCFSQQANDVNVCNGQGQCVAPDNCTCNAGYAGDRCNVPVCFSQQANDANVCSGHGNCTGPDTCSCSEGWTGASCETPVCASNCSGHGQCTAPNTCSCEQGFTGEQCETKVCDAGFTGPNCDVPICFSMNANDTNVCSGNGRCVGPDQCQCNEGYTGSRCESRVNRCDTTQCPTGEICCDDLLVGPLCYTPGEHTCTPVGNNQTRYCCCATCLPCGSDYRCYRTESHQCVNGQVVALENANTNNSTSSTGAEGQQQQQASGSEQGSSSSSSSTEESSAGSEQQQGSN